MCVVCLASQYVTSAESMVYGLAPSCKPSQLWFIQSCIIKGKNFTKIITFNVSVKRQQKAKVKRGEKEAIREK